MADSKMVSFFLNLNGKGLVDLIVYSLENFIEIRLLVSEILIIV